MTTGNFKGMFVKPTIKIICKTHVVRAINQFDNIYVKHNGLP